MATETAMLITNITLSLLTALYVIFTFKLVQEAKIANDINLKTTAEQLKILTSPYLHCEIRNNNNELYVIITNAGSAPAYDVDVMITALYCDMEEIGNCHGINFSEEACCSDDSIYVLDRIVYPMFFHKKQVIAKLDIPKIADSISIFLQYRDTRQYNYSSVLWFIDDTNGKRKSYQLANIEPLGFVVSPRVEMINGKLKTAGKEIIPDYIKEFFENNIRKACTYGNPFDGGLVEDRGEWKNI